MPNPSTIAMQEESEPNCGDACTCEVGHACSKCLPLPFVTSTVAPARSEVRIVDPETGGEKGSKIERFDLIPAEAERHLALVYGAGATKYEEDNWRKGYRWRLSLAALRRHLNAWQRGESNDTELTERAGEPVSHLAAVAWHAFTLLTFENERLGTDDIADRSEVDNG